MSWTCVRRGLVPGEIYIHSDTDLTGHDDWECWRTDSVLTVGRIVEDIARSLYYFKKVGLPK